MTTMSCSAASRWLSPGSAPVLPSRTRAASSRACGSRRRRARSSARPRGSRATCASACQPQPMMPSVRAPVAREVLRGDAARGAGAPLAERVRLDHRREVVPVCSSKRRDDELCLPSDGGIGLHACVAQLAVDGEHHRESTVVERESPPRHDSRPSRRHPQEALPKHASITATASPGVIRPSTSLSER